MGKPIKKVLGAVGDVVSGIMKVFGLELEPTLPDTPYNQNLLATKYSPTSYIGVVYGTIRKAGVEIGTFNGGEGNKYLYKVYALSHGPIKGIKNPKIDDESFSTDKIASLITWSYGLGSHTQDATADSLIAEIHPAHWDMINGKLAGVAFAVVRYTYDQEDLTSVGSVTFDVEGREVFDPRTGITAYSTNNALCALDYQTDKIYGKGMPYPQGFNVPSYISGANHFDEIVATEADITVPVGISSYGRAYGYLRMVNATGFNSLIAGQTYEVINNTNPQDSFTGTVISKEINRQVSVGNGSGVNPKYQEDEPVDGDYYKVFFSNLPSSMVNGEVSISFKIQHKRYSINGNVDGAQTVYDNLVAIGSSFNGYITTFNGVSTLIPDRVEPITAYFDASNITSGIDIQLPDSDNQLNEITGTWVDPERGYEQVTENVKSELYLKRDRGRIQPKEVNLPFCTDLTMVRRILTIELNKSRHAGAIQFTTMWHGLEVHAGEVIAITDEYLGWVNRTYRVIKVGIPDSYSDVTLVCIPFDANDYTDEVINPRYGADYLSYPAKGELTLPSSLTATRSKGTSFSVVTVDWQPSALTPYEKFDLELWLGGSLVKAYNSIYSTSYSLGDVFTVGVTYEFRLYMWDKAGNRSNAYLAIDYLHALALAPTGITITAQSPWMLAAEPTYSAANKDQKALNHKWYVAEFTTVEPVFSEALLVATTPTLMYGGAKPNKSYRVWCRAVTQYDESNVVPQGNGVGVTMPATTTEDIGAIGQALSLRLTSDAQIFIQDADNVVTPAAITLTAIQQNSDNTITWATTPTVTLTGTGKTRTLSKANFGSNDTVKITITADGLSDSITINRVIDGAIGENAISGLLTNESHVVPASNAGVITGNLGAAGGKFRVFNGSTDVTTSASFAKVSSTDLTVTINATTGDYTITAMAEDSGQAVFSATYAGVVITKSYSLSKAKSGSSGGTGTRGSQDFFRPITGTSWSNSEANLAITSAGLTPSIRDTVTLFNATSGSEFSERRFWDGSVWAEEGTVYTGNQFIDGTIGANKLAVTSLSAITANVGLLTSGSIIGANIATAETGRRVELNNTTSPFSIYNSNNSPLLQTVLNEAGTDIELYLNGRLSDGSIKDAFFLSSEGVNSMRERLGLKLPSVATGGTIAYSGSKDYVTGDFPIADDDILSGGRTLVGKFQGNAQYSRTYTTNPNTPATMTYTVQFYYATSTDGGNNFGSWVPVGPLHTKSVTPSVTFIDTGDESGFPNRWKVDGSISLNFTQDIGTTDGQNYRVRAVCTKTSGHTDLDTAAASELASFIGDEPINGDVIEAHGHDWGDLTGLPNSIAGYGITNATFDTNINISTGAILNHNSTNSYDKLRVWDGADYTIGMKSAQTYGWLNDYAMTFTMSNTLARGFLWRDSSDSAADGAMSLTTDGKLMVKDRIGFTGDTSIYLTRSVAQFHAQSQYGYLRFGSSNSSWAHFSTDRPNFHFSAPIHAEGGFTVYTKGTRIDAVGVYDNNNRVYSAGNFGKSQIDALGIAAATATSATNATNADKLDNLDSTGFYRGGLVGSLSATVSSWANGLVSGTYLRSFTGASRTVAVFNASTGSARTCALTMAYSGQMYMATNTDNNRWNEYEVYTSATLTKAVIDSLGVNAGSLGGYTHDKFGKLANSQTWAGNNTFNGAVKVNATHMSNYGIHGGHNDTGGNGSGSDWGANIWSIGTGYDGSKAGVGYTLGNYCLGWVRSGAANYNSLCGEGIYLGSQNAVRGGWGHLGLWTTGTLRAEGTITTPSNIYAYAYRGNGNVAGTGEAIYSPEGLYSTGTNWLYGTIITNNNSINAGTGTLTAGSAYLTGKLVSDGFEVLNGTDTWLRTKTGWYNPTYSAGMYSNSAGTVRGYSSNRFHIYNTGINAIASEGGIQVGGSSNYGRGITGLYSATRFQGVFSMGASYQLPANGDGTGTMYGIAWTHSNNANQNGKKISGHHACFMTAGATKSAIGDHIWTAGNVTAQGYVKGTDAIGTSDIRVKSDLQPILDPLKICKALRTTTHIRSDQNGRRSASVIAQDVEKVFKVAVHYEDDKVLGKKLSVSMPAMNVLAIAGVNANAESVEELKRENQRLKFRLEKLEAAVEKLING